MIESLETRVLFCALHEVAGFTGDYVESEGWDSHVFTDVSASLNSKAAAASASTSGNKSVLYIRVTFSDKPTTDPQSASAAASMMTSVSNFMVANSFGQLSMTATVTDLIVLPQPESYYNTNGDFQLRTDALAAAKAVNPAWDWANFDLDAVRWNGGPGAYSGQAYVGSRGVWLKSSSAGVADHEFGHNLGLWHANYFVPTDRDTVIGPGSNTEYGDVFDTMGAAAGGQQHFNDYEKNLLGWIPDANVSNVTTAGTYRIYANDRYDQGEGFDASRQYGIKIRKDSDRDYWLDYRQSPGWASNPWITNGVGVRWDRWAGSNLGSQWIDTNPNSPDGRTDGAVVIGRTFTDDVSDIHITPIGKGVDASRWIDVRVNFGDPNATGDHAPQVQLSSNLITTATNTAVSFTAAATDLDGDPLAYYWDFGDRTFGTNTPNIFKSWGASGEYRVRLTVSDMKGRTTSESIIVNVANATARRITGRVVDAAGNAIADVRVHNGLDYSDANYRYAFTDADGFYTLTGVPVGTTYAMGAGKAGYSFAVQGFANPVSVGGTEINFVATPARYRITGKVTTDGTTPLAGATVSNGTTSILTDAAGNYVLDALLGANTVTVSKTNYTFPTPSTVIVQYADATLNVSPLTVSVYGRITGAPAGTVVTISDGVDSRQFTVSTGEQGGQPGAYYFLTVRPGPWNLTASANGISFSPVGWTNPLTIDGSTSQTLRDFAADAVRTFTARGKVTSASGDPLSGVVVSAGSFQSTTDTGGGFALTGLPPGDYTLAASLAGYHFGPATRSVSFSAGSADATGQDFAQTAGAAIIGRRLFYNASALDNNDPAANAADDNAVAAGKSPLLPGGGVTSANIGGYGKGINGIMIDVVGLPSETNLSASDFSFRSSTGADWTAGPVPSSITVRRAVTRGVDRVTLIWSDAGVNKAVQNGWIEVTVNSDAATGLDKADVFAFGNLIGDADGNGAVTVGDLGQLSTNFGKAGGATVAQGDFNGDGSVTVGDLGLLSSFFNQTLAAPPSIGLPTANTKKSAKTSNLTVMPTTPTSTRTIASTKRSERLTWRLR